MQSKLFERIKTELATHGRNFSPCVAKNLFCLLKVTNNDSSSLTGKIWRTKCLNWFLFFPIPSHSLPNFPPNEFGPNFPRPSTSGKYGCATGYALPDVIFATIIHNWLLEINFHFMIFVQNFLIIFWKYVFLSSGSASTKLNWVSCILTVPQISSSTAQISSGTAR